MIATRKILTITASLLCVRTVASAASGLRALRTDGVGAGVTLLPQSGLYDNVVVWMHGLGDTADGWAGLMPMLEIENTKFVLPTAESRPITLNGGYQMPGWSDIYGLDSNSQEDAEGFMESAARVTQLINMELEQGIQSKNIVIGGFSQGGALALHVSLRANYTLAGCCALSTWLPLRGDYPGAISSQARTSLKLFQAHGEMDEVVQYKWGSESHAQLREWLELPAEFMPIPGMGHSSDPSEIDAVKNTLQNWLTN